MDKNWLKLHQHRSSNKKQRLLVFFRNEIAFLDIKMYQYQYHIIMVNIKDEVELVAFFLQGLGL